VLLFRAFFLQSIQNSGISNVRLSELAITHRVELTISSGLMKTLTKPSEIELAERLLLFTSMLIARRPGLKFWRLIVRCGIWPHDIRRRSLNEEPLCNNAS
jgi:hypothetical protein